MKRNILLILILAWFFTSCQKENDNNQTSSGQVEFSFEQKTETYTKAGEVGTPAAIVLSVEDLNGNKIFNAKSIELLNMNGSFITKPVTLLAGNYKITSYMVVDGANNVMYTVPLEGSKYAYLVNDPLPVSFSVAHNGYAKLSPQVLSTNEHKPEDFGYPSFSMDTVNTFDFLVATFAYDETALSYKLIPATIEITYANFSYSKNLPAATDTITLINTNADYIVTIGSQGYIDWTDTLTAAELKLYFSSNDRGPLKVFLNKGCNCPPTVTDADGNVYRTKVFGNQCWMLENLKTTKYNDGTPIQNITWSSTWRYYSNEKKLGVYAWWKYDTINKNLGAFYNYYTVKTGKLAPKKWHVPSLDEWFALKSYIDLHGNSEFEMKTMGYLQFNGFFVYWGTYGWWVGGWNNEAVAFYNDMNYGGSGGAVSLDFGFSVRCVHD